MDRKKHEFYHSWHVALNRYNTDLGPENFKSWMYESKRLAQEVVHLKLVFGMERQGKLTKEEDFLTCCLGVKCRECPELQALNKMEKVTPEQMDEAKAWTCATHIVSTGGDTAREGYVMTADDRKFWDHVYESVSHSGD
jgi:hypothetical protein